MRSLSLSAVLLGSLLSSHGLPVDPGGSLPHQSEGPRWRYLVLSGTTDMAPPFITVDVIFGPEEKVGSKRFRWWQLEIHRDANRTDPPTCVVRALTSPGPLSERRGPLQFARYQVHIPETGETLEYREVNTGNPLLPAWPDFQSYFLPAPTPAAHRRDGAPSTCEFLGQVATLEGIDADHPWPEWNNVKRLDLNREVLVGTALSVKDKEGHRLPRGQDYTYVPFEEEDFRTRIEAGFNLFPIKPEQEQWVRSEAVFYLRPPSGMPALRYPADLYRANYLGVWMFVDEPAALTYHDFNNARRLSHHLPDVSALFEKRTRASFWSAGPYGAHYLERELRQSRINLGDMRLVQRDYPIMPSPPSILDEVIEEEPQQHYRRW